MGMVYRAWDEALEREVAIKTLTAEGILDEESRKRFEVEAKAVARMQHTNIITVFELGEDRGIPFIAMELLGGLDLETVLRTNEPLLLEEKLEIMIQVCRGLAYAHGRGIVHRDVKPSNIRLLDDGSVKLMDFGIAKLGGMNLTKTGMMVGTLHYMSPEQIRGLPLDGRSDVFSLGVILHELLSGDRPFKAQGTTEVLYEIVNATPPRLAEDGSGRTEALQRILDTSLAKDRDERYPGAAEFGAALQENLDDLRKGHAAIPSKEEAEALATARKLVSDGRPADAVRQLESLLKRRPTFVEARRTLRTARHAKRPSPAAEDFPELDQTIGPAPATRPAETLLQPTTLLPDTRKARALPWALVGGGLTIAVVVAATLLLLLMRSRSGPVAVRVRSKPPGASVFLEGRQTGITTDGEVSLPRVGPMTLAFRKEGYEEVVRTLPAPPESREVEVDLPPIPSAPQPIPVKSDPPGATVTVDGEKVSGTTPLSLSLDPAKGHKVSVALEGYSPQEMHLEPGKLPQDLAVTLPIAGVPGTLVVLAPFPIEVSWRGKVLSQAAGAKISLPAGRQTVTIASANYFLHRAQSVDVRSGETTTLEAPALGKISIRANPDNCQVLIDGAFVDYPPILDRAIASGDHTVSFKWPDGLRRDEAVKAEAGGLVFVTGRRE
jgi:hypothetical protein